MAASGKPHQAAKAGEPLLRRSWMDARGSMKPLLKGFGSFTSP
jgi:hypothetical protein